MVNTTGGVSYNILKTFNVGGVVKGMSGVKWYNNTFYQDRPTYSSTDPTAGTWRGAIDVYTNTDVTPNSVSHGTKIKNNIFYSKYKTYAINVMDAESLIDFECDYNVYWVEEGDHMPVFNAGGSSKTWAQWRAMGYDAHSVVMNPNFIDFVNFVPTARLDYGTDLGSEFNTGLATTATWVVNSSPATQVQNGTWQVGARIYAPVAPTPYLNVSTNAITVNSNAGSTGTFNISSNIAWNVVSSQSWLTPSVTSGSNNSTIILTATANALTETRIATVTVSGVGVSNQVITVTQQAANAFLFVSTNNLTIPATANTDGKFNIISNTDWTVTSSQPWLTVGVELFYSLSGQGYKTVLYSGTAPDIGAFEYMQTSATGHDSAFVTLQAEVNTGTLRTATVSVTGTGVTPTTIYVTQEGTTQPIVPIYLSSKIDALTPQQLEMTYDKTLANIVPDPSSFTVKINSIVKDITSVSISGSKVTLTLAYPVYLGGVVTVSYIKPTTNPLQTPEGGQAGNITSQPVTNNSTQTQKIYYVSPSGSDDSNVGDGTIADPWFTLNKAWSVAAPGITFYMRGGTYSYLQQQRLRNKNGTAVDSIRLFAYPGEKPIISRGEPYVYPGYPTELVVISGDYISVKKLDVSGNTQKETGIWGGIRAYFLTNSTFDRIDIHHNGGGMQLTNTDKCVVINSDFHHNQDPLTTSAGAYGNADGMGIDWLEASSLGITDPIKIAQYNQQSQDAVNYIISCRFWYNTDDGIDDWEYEGNLYIDNCWAFWNGFIPDTWNKGGDGNGFKLGRTSISAPNVVKTRVYNSIAFQNKKWGFLDNGARCNMEIYNNTAYQNAYKGLDSWAGGFNFTTTPEAIKYFIKNNIAYANGNDVDVSDITNINHNSWDLPVTVTDADFKTISTLGADGARQSNGSLPEINFLHLVESSDLRLAGVDVGLPFGGINPDLGAYQYHIKPTGTVVQGTKTIVIKGATIKLK